MSSTNTKSAEFSAVVKFQQVWNAAASTTRDLTREAALVTFKAYDAGLIGKGTKDTGGFGTMAEFASMFQNPLTGNTVSISTVSAWRRVGKGIALGVDESVLLAVTSVANDKAAAEGIDKANSKTAYAKAVAAGTKAKATKAHGNKGKTNVPGTDTEKGQTKADSVPLGRNNTVRCESIAAILAGMSAPRGKERQSLAEIVETIGTLLGVDFVIAEVDAA